MEKRKKGTMEVGRKPFQGVINIVRFNWHFYLITTIALTTIFFFANYLPEGLKPLLFVGTALAIFTIIISLLVSYYIYDVSDLYELTWLPDCNKRSILNVSAGFDESSDYILAKYPGCKLEICDFYDPIKHTEVSIKRARTAYPPHGATISVTTESLPFKNKKFDCTLANLAAHEIRNEEERINFFIELKRVTKDEGQIYVTEHLRDVNNFIAYNIGFLHFHSKSTWLSTFENAGFAVVKEIKTTPFISTFILKKHGNTH